MNLSLGVLTYLLLLLQISACSMAENTEEVKDTSNKIEAHSDQLAQRTEELRLSMRELESTQFQREVLPQLFSTQGTAFKLQLATLYFSAFEFQKWTNRFSDDEQNLLRLKARAIEIFFSSIDDLINDKHEIDTLKPNSNWINLGVLAATMSQIDDEQIKVMTSLARPSVSIFDLIVDALMSGTHLFEKPKYVERVFEWHNEAIYLLQLRHNFLPVMVLGRITPFEDGFWNQVKGAVWGFEVNPNQFNSSQWKQWTKWLSQTLETREILTQLGVEIQINTSINRVLRNIRFISEKTAMAPDSSFIEFRNQLEKLTGCKQSDRLQ